MRILVMNDVISAVNRPSETNVNKVLTSQMGPQGSVELRG